MRTYSEHSTLGKDLTLILRFMLIKSGFCFVNVKKKRYVTNTYYKRFQKKIQNNFDSIDKRDKIL